jgi:hypothetical protein
MRAIRRVNTNVDKFMVDNANISDVDFEDVFVRYREYFVQWHNFQFKGENMMIILARGVILGIKTITPS